MSFSLLPGMPSGRPTFVTLTTQPSASSKLDTLCSKLSCPVYLSLISVSRTSSAHTHPFRHSNFTTPT